ncbi:MAG TPA: ATP-grasp domain-containing protein, partial [Erysipelothrix sp.]
MLSKLCHPIEKTRKAHEINNLIYPAFKAPIWPFDLMPLANRNLGTQMKSVGEAMAMSNHLEGAMHQVFESISLENYETIDDQTLLKAIEQASDQRLASLLTLIKRGYDLALLSEKSQIKRFFIAKMKQALNFSNDDFYFSSYEQNNKMISMNWKNEAIIQSDKKTILFIAPGPSKIGQGIEFDYALMKAMLSVQKMGYRAIVLNNNPATVSTDFKLADAVYFGALTIENIEKIVAAHDNFAGIILQFGGQKAIDLAAAIEKSKIKILGTSLAGIHRAENRAEFKSLLDALKIKQARSCIANDKSQARTLAQTLNYPLIVRPSFILAGKDMHIIQDEQALRKYLNEFTFTHPLLIDEYISGRECDVDIVYDGKTLIYSGAMEHIEKSGVHSGDSTLVYPAQNISEKQEQAMKEISLKLAEHLKIRGILNIQFILNEKGIYVIEANPRASRTVPFLYKASGIDIIDLATKAILSQPLNFEEKKTKKVSLKFPIFSFEKLAGVDPILGPSMKSTGEMMLQGESLTTVYEQMLQAKKLNLDHFKMVYLAQDDLALNELKAKGHELVAYQEGIDFTDVDCVYCEMESTKTHYELRRHAIEQDCLLLQNHEQVEILIDTLRKWERHATI